MGRIIGYGSDKIGHGASSSRRCSINGILWRCVPIIFKRRDFVRPLWIGVGDDTKLLDHDVDGDCDNLIAALSSEGKRVPTDV